MKKVIYVDIRLQDELKRGVERSLKQVKPIIKILKDNGFEVSRANVLDCLNMVKEQARGEQIDGTVFNWLSESQVLAYQVDYIYKNCPNLNKEFGVKLEEVLKGENIPILRKEKEALYKEQYDRMRSRIFDILHPFNGEVETQYLKRWFDVEHGDIILTPDIDRLIKDEATVYCETKAAEKALDLHQQAAALLSQFIALFPQNRQPEDVGDLFYIEENMVHMRELNYNIYLKK